MSDWYVWDNLNGWIWGEEELKMPALRTAMQGKWAMCVEECVDEGADGSPIRISDERPSGNAPLDGREGRYLPHIQCEVRQQRTLDAD